MPFRFEPNGIEWIDEVHGRTLNLDGAADLVDQLIDSVDEDEIDEILDILGDEPTDEEVERWKLRFWVLLKWLYVALGLMAAAGALTVEDWESVQILLLAQLFYLDRFAQGIATGAVSKAEAGRRMRMYVNSARSAFWTVLDRQMLDAGYTEEKWIAIGDANTCSPCNEAAGMSWQPIGTFAEPGSGYVLRDPTTECQGLSLCRCQKAYR
ncbi:MAG: hypothetical protein ACYSWU_02055 [Planctomycetota bacterium]|jgi:hypothetical protein